MSKTLNDMDLQVIRTIFVDVHLICIMDLLSMEKKGVYAWIVKKMKKNFKIKMVKRGKIVIHKKTDTSIYE